MTCNRCEEYASTKPPLTPGEQVARLEDRGLIVEDEAAARVALERIGYSRLRPYWYPFEQNHNTHSLMPGTRFEDAILLYDFDASLRLVVFGALGRIEVALRAAWANHLSLIGGDPYVYLGSENYHQPEAHRENIEKLLSEWDRAVDHDPQLVHYRVRYCPEESCPPVWLASEVMSFGLLSKFFSNLRNRHPAKRAIAADFGFGPESVSYLGKVFRMLALARNRIAHHSRFWDYRWTTFTLPKRGHGKIEPLASALVGADPHTSYYVLSHIVFIDNVVTQSDSQAQDVLRLLNRLPSKIRAIALRRMGFLKDSLSAELWSP